MVAFATILTAACGSDSSSSDPQPMAPDLSQGLFVDAKVTGLKYDTATQSGFTDEGGYFNYIAGEDVTFSIGGIRFPTVAAKELLTPLDLFNTDNIDDIEVLNTIRLLQSLDDDGDLSNGIQIPEVVHQLASTISIDFNDPNFIDELSELIELSGVMNTGFVSLAEAKAHFLDTLAQYDITPAQNCGSDHPMVGYSGTFTTFSHDVAGTATIVDNCTIEVTNFSYDGGGPDVYFYGAIDHAYAGADAFSIGTQLTGTVFNDDTVVLNLPSSKSLDDLNTLSVWCVDFSVDFGSLRFEASQ